MKFIKTIVALAVSAAIPAISAGAQGANAPHPKYNEVLSDLHYAYGLLDKESPKGRVDSAQGQAKSEINQAIDLVKRAELDDHQAENSHPPVDAQMKDTDRFQKAGEVLKQARQDIDADEQRPQAKELKTKAILHINEALNFTRNAYEASKK